jgi:hypothetical protein
MMPIHSFGAAAAAWQNFYLLAGTAAATLIGLMFVAVTFGASLVNSQTTSTARAFLDPTLAHFIHVLLTACLMVSPTIGATLLGSVLLTISVVRTAGLVRTFRHMKEAHRKFNDVELSDWLTGIALPFLLFLLLAASGAGFLAGYAAAFSALGIATVAILLLGIIGAWELMIWMALTRARAKDSEVR